MMQRQSRQRNTGSNLAAVSEEASCSKRVGRAARNAAATSTGLRLSHFVLEGSDTRSRWFGFMLLSLHHSRGRPLREGTGPEERPTVYCYPGAIERDLKP